MEICPGCGKEFLRTDMMTELCNLCEKEALDELDSLIRDNLKESEK